MKTTLFSKQHAKQQGLTLVEACVVLAVTAIVAGVATPNMQGLLDARRLEGTASQLVTDLQFTRNAAVARNEPVRISLRATGNGSCYVIHTGNAGDCSCAAAAGPAQCRGDAREIKTVRLGSGDRVSLRANVSSMLFDPLHGTSTPTGTWRVIGSQERAIHHVVNVMGRVRSCSPQGAVPGYRAC